MGYLTSIKTAMAVFSVLAFAITLPYMIFNYRKYGSISKLRTLILYSFVYYLLTVYLLVILPLPNPKAIHTSYTEMLNLIPFSFVVDFIKKSPFVLFKPATWITALKHPSFYVPVFNVVMLIPFGIYLHYYFKCSFKKTMVFTALLSLFFELTQLSGVYFIYPGPYRLCDIDDIIQNVAGGCIGYIFGGLVIKLLPSRNAIDDKALKDGTKVSAIRLCLSLIIDSWIVSIPCSLLNGVLKVSIPLPVCLALYFSLLPLLLNGKTLGSALLEFRIEFENAKCVRTILRGLLLTAYFWLIPSGLLELSNQFNNGAKALFFLVLYAITLLAWVLFAVITVAVVLLNRRFLFDYLTGTIYISNVRKPRTE